MRTPACCICKNENADQLHSNCAADKRLRYIILLIYIWPSSLLIRGPVCAMPHGLEVIRLCLY